MMDIGYYRDQAARARHFAAQLRSHPEIQHNLLDMAKDFDEIASDIEADAVRVRHPERLSPKQRAAD